MSVASQVETYKQAQKVYGIQGRSTVLVWLRKHGTLDWTNPIAHSMNYHLRDDMSSENVVKAL